MSISKDRIRAKLAMASGQGNINYWKPPKEGQATIRVFPIPNYPDPFAEIFSHYGVRQSGGGVYCLRRNLDADGLEGHCPLCDLNNKLRAGDADDQELSKQIYAKPRYFAAVIDRADKEPVGKYWGFSKTLYLKMMGWLAEEDGGDHEKFMDIDEGIDLVVSVTNTGKSFPEISVDCKRRDTPLLQDKSKIKSFLQSVKPIDEVFTRPSVEEVQRIHDNYMNDHGGGNHDTPGVSKQAPAAKSTERTQTTQDDLDRLFESVESA